MNHDSSRKQFFARMLGLVAAASVGSKLFAKAPGIAASASAPAAPAIKLRPATRIVARRADSL